MELAGLIVIGQQPINEKNVSKIFLYRCRILVPLQVVTCTHALEQMVESSGQVHSDINFFKGPVASTVPRLEHAVDDRVGRSEEVLCIYQYRNKPRSKPLLVELGLKDWCSIYHRTSSIKTRSAT